MRLFVRDGAVVHEVALSTAPVLTDDVALELADLALDVEARFGAPVDIEAAWAAERWILLQARPITTGSTR